MTLQINQTTSQSTAASNAETASVDTSTSNFGSLLQTAAQPAGGTAAQTATSTQSAADSVAAALAALVQVELLLGELEITELQDIKEYAFQSVGQELQSIQQNIGIRPPEDFRSQLRRIEEYLGAIQAELRQASRKAPQLQQ